MDIKIGNEGKVNIIPVVKDQKTDDDLLNYLVENNIFTPNYNEIYLYVDKDKVADTVYVGLGEEDKIDLETYRNVFFTSGKKVTKAKYKSVNILVAEIEGIEFYEGVTASVEGFLHSQYDFDKYKSKKYETSVEDLYVLHKKDNDKVLEAVKEAEILVESINITRDLINIRAIDMYPEVLANQAIEILEPVGVKVTVLEREEIEKHNMEAFLAVTEGSEKEPRFIVMEYKGNPDSDEVTALVGKGITYDSGGYSLKPNSGMLTMFADMSGSATVIGGLHAIAKAGLKANVTGVVAACENLVSGGAYKPGDVIGSMGGKTIEILSTDAEGRLTLADAVYYAADVLKADRIVDIATLTGACVVALGEETTGAITNDMDFYSEVVNAGDQAGEQIWQLPSDQKFKDAIKSEVADLKNSAAPGAITAGVFIEEFVKDTPWVHLDIAGPAYKETAKGYHPRGATGVHVKTFFNMFK